eukprot:TRINITY_DN15755_c0_g1_i1.p1 TRINITY_DN15755_c0_g1~~TRINITY_DN15755_c0_g1_i1.p1  ORF type:complete len:258 (+),score=46.50 TRINITY_DN15755_c0_g1_i1:64-837(+)
MSADVIRNGSILHQMIDDNGKSAFLSQFLRRIEECEDVILWRNPYNMGMNALQAVYSRKNDLQIAAIEEYCSHEIIERHGDYKILGSFFPEFLRVMVLEPSLEDQGMFIHSAIKENATEDILKVLVRRLPAVAREWKNDEDMDALDVVMYYRYNEKHLFNMFESQETRKLQMHWRAQGRLPIGIRVGRGKEWNGKGYRCKGTVVGPLLGFKGYYTVQWDNGARVHCYFGYLHRFWLRVLPRDECYVDHLRNLVVENG